MCFAVIGIGVWGALRAASSGEVRPRIMQRKTSIRVPLDAMFLLETINITITLHAPPTANKSIASASTQLQVSGHIRLDRICCREHRIPSRFAGTLYRWPCILDHRQTGPDHSLWLGRATGAANHNTRSVLQMSRC